MTIQNKGQALLENAYKLKTAGDNIEYYDDFATVYDQDFAQDMGWYYPRAIAELYSEFATSDDLSVVDIGCGTGLVAEALNLPVQTIDGLDISNQMLRIARYKDLYGNLYQIDLTKSLASFSNTYGAILSAGTFTHGHLGPDELENIISLGRQHSLYIIGINRDHFSELEFDSKIESLIAESTISPVEIREIPMFSKKDHDHGSDIALVVIFRKC